MLQGSSCSAGDVHRRRSSLESLFCYDKAIPEEIIEKPIGLSLAEKVIGNNSRILGALIAKRRGLSFVALALVMVYSILESQGIIVKVRFLGKVLIMVCLEIPCFKRGNSEFVAFCYYL